MKHPERVEDYLQHIEEAIERTLSYIQPLRDLAAFQKNPQVQDAVVRNIEIIGEAVNKIARTAPDFIREHPEIPLAANARNAQHRHTRILLCGPPNRMDHDPRGFPHAEKTDRSTIEELGQRLRRPAQTVYVAQMRSEGGSEIPSFCRMLRHRLQAFNPK